MKLHVPEESQVVEETIASSIIRGRESSREHGEHGERDDRGETGGLLADLERRQDEVIEQLDTLNERIEAVLRDAGVTPEAELPLAA